MLIYKSMNFLLPHPLIKLHVPLTARLRTKSKKFKATVVTAFQLEIVHSILVIINGRPNITATLEDGYNM